VYTLAGGLDLSAEGLCPAAAVVTSNAHATVDTIASDFI
jgi:hypothetical protein